MSKVDLFFKKFKIYISGSNMACLVKSRIVLCRRVNVIFDSIVSENDQVGLLLLECRSESGHYMTAPRPPPLGTLVHLDMNICLFHVLK